MAEPSRSDASRSSGKKMSETANVVKTSAGTAPTNYGGSGFLDMMLGEFRLLRKLGSGGMARVYLAEQTTLRRQVAVKVLRPEYVTDEQYVKRFRHEAAAAGSLNHPNIVQVYMVGEEQGVNYIAQEYVQGRTLKDYLKRKGPIDVKIGLHILRQIASALHAAGESGIVHRDIKPENILLTSKGEAKVADFGLAQLTQQGERISLTQSGITMGTPLYMSPEQINGLPLDARSDIYSFGIMTWHMFAGRPPFMGESAMAIAVKHLNDKPLQLTDFREDLPLRLVELVQSMIQKKKEDRPADFGVVLNEIKQLIRLVVGKEESMILRNPARKRSWIFDKPLRKQAGWLIVTCAVVFTASAGIGWAKRAPDIRTISSKGRPRVTEWTRIEPLIYHAETNPQDEAAWISVKEFPGVSAENNGRARTALAMIYLKTQRRHLAERAFDELSLDPKLKVNGLAGLAIIAQLKGNPDGAKSLIEQVDAMPTKLFPEIENDYKDLHRRLKSTK